MPTRPTALTGAVLSLVLLATACGGGGSPPTELPATSSATSPSAAPEASTPPGSGYLPVPGDVTLTEGGAMLELRDTAVVAWEPRQGLVGVLEVTVTRIDQTTVQASLAGFDLEGDEQRSTPYFVKTRVTNVGDTDLGGRQVPLYLLTSQGVLIAPTGVARDFANCPDSLFPDVFAPGDTSTSCLIFLAPEGSQAQSITFRPPEGVIPLQWRGKVTDLGKSGKKSSGKRGRKR
ncbi:MAG: hypothetical protein WB471_03230 [Nocardioides sp.]